MISKNIVLKIAVNSLIGAILIAIWLQFVNIKEIISSLSTTNLSFLPLILISLFFAQAIRALRLKIVLAPVKKIPLKELVFLNGVGVMLNFLIPIRGGEIIKSLYLAKGYDLPVSKSFVWIFLDRFIDFLAVLVLSGILLLIVPTNLPSNIIPLVFTLSVILLLVSYLMIYKQDFARILFKFLTPLLIFKTIKIYFERVYEYFLGTFTILKRGLGEVLLIAIITVLGYAADAFVWYFTFLALGNMQDYLKMYLGQLLSALTYLIPAAPGYIGSAEASGLLIFSGVFGIETNLASTMTVLFHIVVMIFIIIFGLISIYSLKMDLPSLFRKILERR